MIKSISSRSLKRLYEKDDGSKIDAAHLRKVRNILSALEAASDDAELNLPGFHLHPLQGDRAGVWAITVRANWRITFRFERGDAFDVNYEDYH